MVIEILKAAPQDWADFEVVDSRRDPDWACSLEREVALSRKAALLFYPLSHTLRLETLCRGNRYILMVHPDPLEPGLGTVYLRPERREAPRPGTLTFAGD